MKSGHFIGVMSGTSLDGIDVVLAAINESVVAQQASLSYPIPVAIKRIFWLSAGTNADVIPARSAGYASGALICRCRAGPYAP